MDLNSLTQRFPFDSQDIPMWPKVFIISKVINWDILLIFVQHFPQEIKKIHEGATLLHLLMYRKAGSHPPMNLVDEVINIFPDALSIKDFDGDLPLHCAFQSHIDVPVLLRIIDANPAALFAKNKNGMTPLYCSYSVSQIKAVTKQYPECLGFQNDDGMTPFNKIMLSCATALGWKKLLYAARCPMLSIFPLSTMSSFDDLRISTLQHQLWVLSELIPDLIRSASYSTMPVLHASLLFQNCPLQHSRVMIALFSEDVNKKNAWGDYPLHIAANLLSNPRSTKGIKVTVALQSCLDSTFNNETFIHAMHSFQCTRKQKRIYARCLSELIKDLTNIYPDAAKVRNAKGCLPHDTLISSGATWRSGLVPLSDAYPVAIHPSRLGLNESIFPRILSKVAKDCKLNTIFGLLRAEPSIIQNGHEGIRRSVRKRKRVVRYV